MRFDISKPEFSTYGVFLNGEIQKYAVRADDEEGWVRIEWEERHLFFGRKTQGETRYGKVFIVNMDGYEPEEYRAPEFTKDDDK